MRPQKCLQDIAKYLPGDKTVRRLRTTAWGQRPYKIKFFVPLPIQIVPLTLWSTSKYIATHQYEIQTVMDTLTLFMSMTLNRMWPIWIGGEKQALITSPPFTDMGVHALIYASSYSLDLGSSKMPWVSLCTSHTLCNPMLFCEYCFKHNFISLNMFILPCNCFCT